ncbi:MAG: hypothetical protein P8Y69_00080 [Gammaproteobacteria bacterium]
MDALLDIPGQALIGAIGLLDSLPGYIRAMLSAALLAGFLRLFETRIPRREVLYGQSFRKTVLVVLIFIPVMVWLFPSSRMVVFVEELPDPGPSDHWLWHTLLLAWLTGFLAAGTQLARVHWRARQEVSAMTPVDDEKLLSRLVHWQRRLGVRKAFELVAFTGDAPRQLIHRRVIGIPSAATHWPGSALDVVIIQSLSANKQHHGIWHLLAQLVSCLYWPVTWVPALHARLLADFQRAGDELTESCYQDHLGYDRALRQLQQRLSARDDRRIDADERIPAAWRMPITSVRRWSKSLLHRLTPEPEPDWNLDTLVAERDAEKTLVWTDPYDKVVLFVGQAMFLAFLLTGVTLKEKPADFEDTYAMPFALLWKEHFHRNQELMDRTQRSQ